MAELPKAPQRGDDILQAFNRLRDFVRKERLMSVVGGLLTQTEGGKTLSIRTSLSTPFSGTAYVSGNKTTGLGTKDWVRCFLDTGTAEDHDGPAPNPFPPNEEWYEVAFTPGDIHESRA